MKTRYCVGSLLAVCLAMAVLVGANCPGGITIPTEFTNADLARLSATAGAGVNCFLVGEALMREDDVEAATRALLTPSEPESMEA